MTTWDLDVDPSPTDLAESLDAPSSRNGGASFWPSPPQSVEELGLPIPFIEDHLCRVLYFGQSLTGAELAAACGVPYVALQNLIHSLTREHAMEVAGQTSRLESGYRYILAPKGRVRAEEALNYTWYDGTLPVPLDDYVAAIKAQANGQVIVRREALREAFSDLVVSDEFLDRIGPAVNGGASIFMYGAPGNGKTATAERITKMIGGNIFIPRAVEAGGSIIRLYDELNHEPVADGSLRRYDGRWVRVKRPVIVTGGELTLAALDLVWSESGKFYEAPLQMKANGGSMLIDDFGRQLVRPADLLNRWIVPLEKRIDFYTLRTGKKIEVPFEMLLLFSTNLDPSDLADEAFLRRLGFRVPYYDPDESQFAEILKLVCRQQDIPFDPNAVEWLLATWWRPYDRPLRMVQPRDLINQILAISAYLGREPALETDLLDRACLSLFIQGTTRGPTAAKV